MKKLLIPLIFILFSSTAYACIFPDQTQLYYPIDMEELEDSLYDYDIDYDTINNSIIIDYDEYVLTASKNVVTVLCRDPMFNCIDEDEFEDIVKNLEKWDAYDLSKEDKENIVSLFNRNVIIRKIDKTAIWGFKIKNLLSRYIGNFLCVNYEEIQECKDIWCSSIEFRGKVCPTLKC